MRTLKFWNKKRYAGLLLLLFCAMTGVFLFWHRPADVYMLSTDAKDGSYQMPTGISMEEMERLARESAIRIQINARPEVTSGSSNCNLMIGNPIENSESLKIRVVLDETGEEVFQSEELKPGERIPYVTLDMVPAAGEYSATATVTILDSESGNAVGTVDAGLIMTVYE